MLHFYPGLSMCTVLSLIQRGLQSAWGIEPCPSNLEPFLEEDMVISISPRKTYRWPIGT